MLKICLLVMRLEITEKDWWMWERATERKRDLNAKSFPFSSFSWCHSFLFYILLSVTGWVINGVLFESFLSVHVLFFDRSRMNGLYSLFFYIVKTMDFLCSHLCSQVRCIYGLTDAIPAWGFIVNSTRPEWCMLSGYRISFTFLNP